MAVSGMANFRAKFNCPGCGSPLETPEGTISLRCSYCGLIMRIGSPGRILKYFYESSIDDFGIKFSLEKHFKENSGELSFKPVSKQLYYLPFYRYRGMAYSLISEKRLEEDDSSDSDIPPPTKTVFHQKCRHFDITIPGFSESVFGLDSLGIRPEVMPLSVCIGDNMPGDAVILDIPITPEDAEQRALGMFAFNLGMTLESKECLITEMIGEGLSIIYYPVWAFDIKSRTGAETYFIDGLSKRVISGQTESLKISIKSIDNSRSSRFSPVAHKCPNCGYDLPVSESSLIYYCENCSRSYLVAETGYDQIETKTAIYEAGSGHYPFWRFKYISGDNLETVGQYSKILTGEIPLIAKDKAQNPFYLYIPAFKLPDLENLTGRILRICRSQPVLTITGDKINPMADPILPQSEAIELARYYWNVMRSKYRQLMTPKYDFKIENIGAGEFVWLTMSEISPNIGRGKTAAYAK